MATGKHYLLKIIIYLYLERGLRITIEIYILYIFLLALWHEIIAEEDRNDPYYICKGNNGTNAVGIDPQKQYIYVFVIKLYLDLWFYFWLLMVIDNF